MSRPAVLGWDIGGANTKAALVAGNSIRIAIRPYPVWKDPQGLAGVLSDVGRQLGVPTLMAATLTAELADCFSTKHEGVAVVIGALLSAFPHAQLRIFGSDGAFYAPHEALRDPLTVASANWAATARLISREVEDALLVDVGTTTTDIVPVIGGRVAATGRTDPERLSVGELVYTGAVRTPVCAVARTVPFRGRRCRTAAELFAQTGDVHLWLGLLEEADYSGDTPDGRGKSREEVASRLARVVCADATMATDEDLTVLAEHVASCQVRLITAAIRQVCGRLKSQAPRMALTAGVGSVLARMASARAGLQAGDLAQSLGRRASAAAPAVAVARLLAEETT